MRNSVGPFMAFILLASAVCSTEAQAFQIRFNGGTFHGPGALGDQPFPRGVLRNLILTGRTSGFIPFVNNGPALPNVSGEINQGGVVDGKLSDGVTLINENIDLDPIRFGSALVLLAVVNGGPNEGVEHLEADGRGNLVLRFDSALDPGFPEGISYLNDFHTSSGVARVPLSIDTQKGRPGGEDRAGSLSSGAVLIGRVGDFDNDGFIDGMVVNAQNMPLHGLPITQGAPVATSLLFTSDIPVTGAGAGLLTVNGIAQNFPEVTAAALSTGTVDDALERLNDVLFRIEAAQTNLHSSLRQDDLSRSNDELVREARHVLREAHHLFRDVVRQLEEGTPGSTLIPRVSAGFHVIGAAVALLFPTQPTP